MNSSPQSSSSLQHSSSQQYSISRLAEMSNERNRSDCLISEIRFLASMMRHDGILHKNIEIITSKADEHMKRRWAQIEQSEIK
jgi:hypothetical protein